MFDKIRELYIKDWEKVQLKDEIYSKLMNKTILVTGATGLVGTGLIDFLVYLNRKLTLNIEVIAVARSKEKIKDRFSKYLSSNEIKVIQQDICEPLNQDLEIDYIIHAASNADPLSFSKDPVGTMKANIEGTIHLLEFCKIKKTCRFLFISSSEVYGNLDSHEELAENDFGVLDCNLFRSCYPESKRVAETLCNSYANQYDVEVVISRLCYVYGPTMTSSDSRVSAQFIRNAVAKEDIVLKSEGKQRRSYCYITDAVTGIIYTLVLGKSMEAYNLAHKKSHTSIRNIAEILAKQNNLSLKFDIPNAEEAKGYSKQNNITLNAEKLLKLGWIPQVSLEEGLHKSVQILAINKGGE